MTYVKGRAPPVRMPDLLEVEQQIVANDLVLLDHGLGDIEYNGTKLANLCQQLGKLYIGISAHVSFCKVEFMAKHELDVHPMFVTTLENVILGEVAKIQHESVH
ncbi:MAG TPA: hypothetical protein PKA60_01435 [Candidatus Paceibacterota bacterium]|nr:hypothetical protein [Candidatus Paceibacterota bacterium]